MLFSASPNHMKLEHDYMKLGEGKDCVTRIEIEGPLTLLAHLLGRNVNRPDLVRISCE